MKYVSLTFDDARKCHYRAVFPIMLEFDYVGTCYIVPSWINTPEHMTVNQLNILSRFGWEIGGHTYTHPKLILLSNIDARNEIARCYGWLRRHNFEPKTFAYPYGFQDARIRSIVSKFFIGGRLDKNINAELYKVSPYLIETLPSHFVDRTMRILGEFFDSKKGRWITIMFHEVKKDNAVAGKSEVSTGNFERILTKIKENNGKVITVHDGIIMNKKGEMK